MHSETIREIHPGQLAASRIRVTCGHCGTAVLVKLKDLHQQFPEGKCLKCKLQIDHAEQDKSVFKNLSDSICHLGMQGQRASITFCLEELEGADNGHD